MTTRLIRCFAGLLLVLPFVHAVATNPTTRRSRASSSNSAAPISARVTRDQAAERDGEPAADGADPSDEEQRRGSTPPRRSNLDGDREPALAALNKAATSDDAEVRRRAEQLVAVIENKLYPDLLLTPSACHVAFSPDGTRIVSGGWLDRTVRLWMRRPARSCASTKGHAAPVACVTFFPDGKRIVSGSGDHTARIWRAPR